MRKAEERRLFRREVAHGWKSPDVGIDRPEHMVWRREEQASRGREEEDKMRKFLLNDFMKCCEPIETRLRCQIPRKEQGLTTASVQEHSRL